MSRIERSVERMYGEDDLALSPIFQGGYLNFGFWKEIPKSPTVEDRAKSSQALYGYVFSLLKARPGDTVAEIGSGRGHGSAYLATHIPLRQMVGVDASAHQIERSKHQHAQLVREGRVQFIQGTAENLPLATEGFDRLFSVEAAQHFIDPHAFAAQVFRVLKPSGKLVLTTFFLTDLSHLPKVQERIPTVRDQIDRVIPVDAFKHALRSVGLVSVQTHSIGKQVWKGFDRWLEETDEKDGWGREWFRAYEKGYLDYYVVEAEKP